MSDYRKLLSRADAHFASVAATQSRNLQCGKGCSLCCYGLFEIGAGDLAVIAEGLASLHPQRRARIVRNALSLMESTAHPDLRSCSPEEKESFFDRSDSLACPALDEKGLCMMYDSRPMVCRTFGLPLREGAEYIGDICELNFVEATRAEKLEAAWDLEHEDVAGQDEEYTIPEAIVIAARARGWI